MLQMIKIKSEELAIPLANLLSGYVTELFLELFAAGDYEKKMLLRQENTYGIQAYQKGAVLSLSYTYIGEETLQDFSQETIKDIKDCLKPKGVTFKRGKFVGDDKEGSIELQLVAEEHYLPYTIFLKKEEGKGIYPNEATLRLFVENNRSISLPTYPIELDVAKDVALILEELELLQDFTPYLRVYQAIHTQAVEGRKVKEALERLLQEKSVDPQKAFALWETYGDYHYMRKRWKVCLRQHKIMEPSWIEVFSLLYTFLHPMMKAIVENQIFFEDWMPEIGRYLE